MMMLPKYSLKDVKKHWDNFNDLHAPHVGSHLSHYKKREEAWKVYTKVRDHVLYQSGIITLGQLNQVWYPQMITDAYSPRSIHKN
jgi:hypothetical protein